jgi:4-hydroxy-3-methylbut-2-enyl diphosphate reductase
MKIIIPKYSGFCPGVKNAENKINKFVKSIENNFSFENNKIKKIFLMGPLIHNKNYIEHLKKSNIILIDEEDLKFFNDIKNRTEIENNFKKIFKKYTLDYNSIPIIRTHGITKYLEEYIKDNFENYINLTCIKVKKIQEIIKIYNRNNYFIIISGKKEHPEVISLKSYAKYSSIIEDTSELNEIIDKFKNSNFENILLISQTTYKIENFNFIKEEIEKLIKINFFNKKVTFKFFNTICDITTKREEEASKYAKDTDLIIIIGDYSSSNSIKLYNFLKKLNHNSIFLENPDDIYQKINEINNLNKNIITKIMIVSSSSAPSFLEDKTIKNLNQIFKN